MPKVARVYKVVCRNHHKQLVSWCWQYLRSAGTVVYTPNQWALPKVGLLFAFKTFKAATFLIVPMSNIGEVWLAEAVVSKRPTPKHILHLSALRDGVKKFWCNKGGPSFVPSYNEASVPRGTILCEKIKLIKKVK